jgi:hypothetical protein
LWNCCKCLLNYWNFLWKWFFLSNCGLHQKKKWHLAPEKRRLKSCKTYNIIDIFYHDGHGLVVAAAAKKQHIYGLTKCCTNRSQTATILPWNPMLVACNGLISCSTNYVVLRRESCAVTIEQWALIGYCLFTLSWFGQFGQTMEATTILTKWEALLTWFKISFLGSQNSIFTKLTVKSQQLHQQQCWKREREIKSPWNF